MDLRGRFYLGLLLLLFFLLLVLSGTAWGQESPNKDMSRPLPTPEQSTQKLSANTMPESESILTLWDQLKQELEQSEQDWQTLQELLQGLQTEVNALQSSLTELTARYERLQTSAKQTIEALQLAAAHEQAARIQAEHSRDTWRTAALVTGGITLAGVITVILVITLN